MWLSVRQFLGAVTSGVGFGGEAFEVPQVLLLEILKGLLSPPKTFPPWSAFSVSGGQFQQLWGYLLTKVQELPGDTPELGMSIWLMLLLYLARQLPERRDHARFARCCGKGFLSLNYHKDPWRTRDSKSRTTLPGVTQEVCGWPGLSDSHFSGQPNSFLRYLWPYSQNVSTSGTHFSFWKMLWLLLRTHLRVWRWWRDTASSHRSCPGPSFAHRPVAFLNLKLRCAQAGADRVSPPVETMKMHFWHGLN